MPLQFWLIPCSIEAGGLSLHRLRNLGLTQIMSRPCALQAWVEGKSQSAGEAVRISVQLSVGGAAWGLAVGLAATLWLRFMFETAHAEITLTVTDCLLGLRPRCMAAMC